MCRVTRHHTRKHRISTEELEAKPGIHDIRCHDEALCSFEPEGAEILRERLSYGRRPDSISPAALLGSGWQAAFR
jgi:hypothetical protein